MKLQKIIRPNIAKLKPYVCARQTNLKGVLLDANENPYGRFNRYPDPFCREIVGLLSEFLAIPGENIFVGNGSDEIIDLLMRIFCEPNKDEVIVFRPSYGLYKVCAQINGIKVQEVDLDENFQMDAGRTLAAVSPQTKLIFVCSPNNPTGNLMQDSEILELLEKFKGIVVMDEAYVEFAQKPSLASQVARFPNLVVLRTLSKAWGGAGIRVGYCVCDNELRDILCKVKPPYNVSLTSQKAAKELLTNKRFMLYTRSIILGERDRIYSELRNFGLKVYPSDSNFILFKIGGAKAVKKRLDKAGVIVRETSIPSCLRVSVGRKFENDLFLSELKKCLSKVVFIDRDGVILYEPQDDFQIDSLKEYRLLPGAIEGLKRFKGFGFKLVMVTNQDGLGTNKFPKKNFEIVQDKLIKDLSEGGIEFDEIFLCPHFDSDCCNCRKPKTGLVEGFLNNTSINLKESLMLGDRDSDMQFAKNIGVNGFLAQTNGNSLFLFSKKLTS